MKQKYVAALAAIMLLFSCISLIQREQGEIRNAHDTRHIPEYTIALQDTTQQDEFEEELAALAARFGEVRRSGKEGRQIEIRLPSVDEETDSGLSFAQIDFSEIQEKSVGESGASPDSIPRGGNAVCYIPRKAIDHHISRLLQPAGPTSEEKKTGGPAIIKETSARRLSIELSDSLRNAAGKTVTALNLVSAWNTFMAAHPARGYALFRHVQGVEGYLRGEEAIISGFIVRNNRRIDLMLARPDPHAKLRLRHPDLFPPSLKLGPFVSARKASPILKLNGNRVTPGNDVFLDALQIRMGGDANPFLSFSLGKCDMLVMSAAADIAYARGKFRRNARLSTLSGDLYFLSLALPDDALRRRIARLVDPTDMLRNYLKLEGFALRALHSRGGALPSETPAGSPPAGDTVISILYHTGDPASVQVSEKLLADFSHAGLRCVLDGKNGTDFETALIRRNFGCAVGWCSPSVMTDSCEQMRLAAMWFGDERDERARLREARELPLFHVKRYLLHKQEIGVHGNDLRGVWRKQ